MGHGQEADQRAKGDARAGPQAPEVRGFWPLWAGALGSCCKGPGAPSRLLDAHSPNPWLMALKAAAAPEEERPGVCSEGPPAPGSRNPSPARGQGTPNSPFCHPLRTRRGLGPTENSPGCMQASQLRLRSPCTGASPARPDGSLEAEGSLATAGDLVSP